MSTKYIRLPAIGICLAVLSALGCRILGPPLQPDAATPFIEVSGVSTVEFREFLRDRPRLSEWRWRDDVAGGPAELLIDDGGWRWRLLDGSAGAPRGCVLKLLASDSLRWHDMQVVWPPDSTDAWLPLPRIRVDSPFYADLLDLLATLAYPGFEGRVRHWPDGPIPLEIPPAVSGAVDLARELELAAETWNACAGRPLFGPQSGDGHGVRLVHLAGRILHPPAYVRFVRRDSLGAPIRIHILIGDTYADPWDAKYARRVMLHELGHALLLWEHSADRDHLLWRAGTVTDRPSADELAAIRLWRALPDGLELGGYGRRGEAAP